VVNRPNCKGLGFWCGTTYCHSPGPSRNQTRNQTKSLDPVLSLIYTIFRSYLQYIQWQDKLHLDIAPTFVPENQMAVLDSIIIVLILLSRGAVLAGTILTPSVPYLKVAVTSKQMQIPLADGLITVPTSLIIWELIPVARPQYPNILSRIITYDLAKTLLRSDLAKSQWNINIINNMYHARIIIVTIIFALSSNITVDKVVYSVTLGILTVWTCKLGNEYFHSEI